MPTKHPYVSTTGVLAQVFDQLQKTFPATFNAETLKKLGFAPSNESYIINVIRYLGLIDENDSRTDKAQKVFTLHDPDAFKKSFGELVRDAYVDLFSLYHEGAWSLGDDKLIPFFRQSDQTSEIVGSRQAGTFRALAGYAGHTASPLPKQPGKSKLAAQKVPKATKSKSVEAKLSPGVAATAPDAKPSVSNPHAGSGMDFGLTVRIEINLPATGDQNTYDAIFKSIRENFLNG